MDYWMYGVLALCWPLALGLALGMALRICDLHLKARRDLHLMVLGLSLLGWVIAAGVTWVEEVYFSIEEAGPGAFLILVVEIFPAYCLAIAIAIPLLLRRLAREWTRGRFIGTGIITALAFPPFLAGLFYAGVKIVQAIAQ